MLMLTMAPLVMMPSRTSMGEMLQRLAQPLCTELIAARSRVCPTDELAFGYLAPDPALAAVPLTPHPEPPLGLLTTSLSSSRPVLYFEASEAQSS